MSRAKTHTAEEIIPKLRAAELEIAVGRTAVEAAKKIGVTEQIPSDEPRLLKQIVELASEYGRYGYASRRYCTGRVGR